MAKSAAAVSSISPVFRVTVDERLSADMVRLLVARLKPGVESVPLDDPAFWTDEEQVVATPDNFLARLHIAGGAAGLRRAVVQLFGRTSGRVALKDVLWRSLSEGQVIVSGKFELAGGPGEIPRLVLGGRDGNTLRIDRMASVRQSIARLYSQAVTSGRGNRGKKD